MSAARSGLEAPLAEFVRQARVRLALVLEPSGRVLAQHGFTRSVDVMTACSLAAGIHASSSELGRLLEGRPFAALHHGGGPRELFLASLASGGGELLVLAVFDRESSLGIVRHFFQAFARHAQSAAAAPPPRELLAEDFERELGRNLAALFGRA